MTSDAQIRAFIDRILRLKEEQDTIGEDIRDIYAEAKSMGFDKTAMGQVVQLIRKRGKIGEDAFSEQNAIVELYLSAYEGPALVLAAAVSPHTPAPARARENIEQFPKSDGGEVAAVKGHARLANAAGVEPPPSEQFDPETGEIIEEIATSAGGESEEVAKNAVASASGPDVKRASHSPEEANGMDRDVLRGDEIAQAVPAENARKAVPETEDGSVSHAGAGESPAANSITKPKSALRPNCRNPEACGGYGANHCHSCRKAMREKAEEVA
ncbi:DUF2312 domain-containing protein [Sinorhizobium medicae]|nr:DUF2312 domain-containing protein [Sinorhizobium medicae]MDX0823407.1 DUF2312 domain-containing protein [Sinorhizobium medicae]